jgi:hypothetical protein
MRNFLIKKKDGGPDSPVDAYFLFESKRFGSIALLKFNEGMRQQYHSHAFTAWTWFISGLMAEQKYLETEDIYELYSYSLIPKITPKTLIHRVAAIKNSWCFTIRGPWDNTWIEYDPVKNKTTTFTHGRKILK